jgi:hypothetical protein
VLDARHVVTTLLVLPRVLIAVELELRRTCFGVATAFAERKHTDVGRDPVDTSGHPHVGFSRTRQPRRTRSKQPSPLSQSRGYGEA